MITFVLSLIIICLCYIVKKTCFSFIKGFPMHPGRIPIIGHIHLVSCNSDRAYDFQRVLFMQAYKTEGYNCLQLGPLPFYIFTDLDDCALLLNTCVDKFYIYTFAKAWVGEGLITAPEPVWQHNHKILYPMFRQSVFNGFVPTMNKSSRYLVELFNKKVGLGEFNHELDVNIAGLRTICQSALGSEAIHFTEQRKYVECIGGIFDIFWERFKNFTYHSDFVYKFSALKRKQDGYIEFVDKMSNEVIQKRKKYLETNQNITTDNGEMKPFLDHLIKLTNNGALPDDHIRSEINTLIFAGYETSAATLVYTLMALGHYPDVQDKAYEEIQEVFGDSDRDVEKDDFVKLVYIEAVIKEVLRLYPPVPIVARRSNTEMKLKKFTMPAGSGFVVPIYAINRHPIWGPDVEEFNPERWFDPNSLAIKQDVFASFGFGRRQCIGKMFAMMTMKTTIVHVLRNFKVTSDFTRLTLKINGLAKPASGQHINLEHRK